MWPKRIVFLPAFLIILSSLPVACGVATPAEVPQASEAEVAPATEEASDEDITPATEETSAEEEASAEEEPDTEVVKFMSWSEDNFERQALEQLERIVTVDRNLNVEFDITQGEQ